MSQKAIIRAGIVGSAGYAGGEVVRLLLLHPEVEIAFAQSKSMAGKFVHEVHTDLFGDTTLRFTNTIDMNVDILFLCSGHGESLQFMKEFGNELCPRIIDLSQDFRWKDSLYNFVYGLPELQRELIRTARHVANPGCFATCIELALLPLAAANIVTSSIHISAATGSTGAGQGLSPTSHYSWRTNNHSVYKAFEHQHLFEIGRSLAALQHSFDSPIYFLPQRGSFTRGIFSSVYTNVDFSAEEAQLLYKEYYRNHPFVFVKDDSIDVKQVVNTNKAFVRVQKFGGNLYIESVIDNLLKGAAGQAVQNMNLMFGLDEMCGLRLKGVVY
jgi:N-acetyl-gamma-glutamyl-phosphate reductase